MYRTNFILPHLPALFRPGSINHRRLAPSSNPSFPLCSMSATTSSKNTSTSAATAARDKLLYAKGYRPGDKVVIFDGVCAMCNSGVDFVLRYDTRRQFKFAALQSETGKALAEKFDCPTDLSTMVYVEGDQAFVKSDAMLKIARRMGWVWALPAELALLLMPRMLRDFVYTDVIAKNRYEVFGKRDECRYVEPAERHRFLN